MPKGKRVKVKIDPRKHGALPALMEPVRKASEDVTAFGRRMKNPPKPLKRFWPDL